MGNFRSIDMRFLVMHSCVPAELLNGILNIAIRQLCSISYVCKLFGSHLLSRGTPSTKIRGRHHSDHTEKWFSFFEISEIVVLVSCFDQVCFEWWRGIQMVSIFCAVSISMWKLAWIFTIITKNVLFFNGCSVRVSVTSTETGGAEQTCKSLTDF